MLLPHHRLSTRAVSATSGIYDVTIPSVYLQSEACLHLCRYYSWRNSTRYLLRLSSSRAFGHIWQQLGAILNGQLQHIQPPPTWSRPSANPAGKFDCATSSWGVLFYACHPLESRILLPLPLDDLVSVVYAWPTIRNLRSVTMSDSFLEMAQSKISSFVIWSLYVTFRIFLKHRWWKTFNLCSVLASSL